MKTKLRKLVVGDKVYDHMGCYIVIKAPECIKRIWRVQTLKVNSNDEVTFGTAWPLFDNPYEDPAGVTPS